MRLSKRQPKSSESFEPAAVVARLRPRRLHRNLKWRKVITIYESGDGRYYLRYVLKPGIDKKLSELSACDIDWIQKSFPPAIHRKYYREVSNSDVAHTNNLFVCLVREFFLRNGLRILERLHRRRLPLILRRTADLINLFKWMTSGVSHYQSHRVALNLEETLARRYPKMDMRRFKVLWSKPVDLNRSDMADRLHDAFFVSRVLDVPLEALSGYPVLILLHQDGEGMTMIAPHGVVYPTTVKGVLLSLANRVGGRALKVIGEHLERLRTTIATVTRSRRDVLVDPAYPHDMVRAYFEVAKQYNDFSVRDQPLEPKLELDPLHYDFLVRRFSPFSFEDNATVEDGEYDEEKWSKFIESHY